MKRLRPHRVMVTLVLAVAVFVACSSDEMPERTLEPLDSAAITELLTDATAIGRWEGARYRQWFSADGETVYVTEADRASTGRWRVTPATNTYESWWEGSGWEQWQILGDGTQYYWMNDTVDEPQAFTVVAGDQLIFSR